MEGSGEAISGTSYQRRVACIVSGDRQRVTGRIHLRSLQLLRPVERSKGSSVGGILRCAFALVQTTCLPCETRRGHQRTVGTMDATSVVLRADGTPPRTLRQSGSTGTNGRIV